MDESRPVVDRPDSVTHWTCPSAPDPATMTHHIAYGKCAYCGEWNADLRKQLGLS